MNKITLQFVVFVFAAWFGTAHSQMYFKCTSSNGKVEFSDKLCGGNLNREQVQTRTNTLDNSGAREGILRQQNIDLQKRLDESERGRQAPSAYERDQAVTQTDKSTSVECSQATRSYEIASGSINPVRNTIQAKRSAMFIACGTKEPDVNIFTTKPTRGHFTKDQFGTTVNSNSCYWTKDAFGTSVKSAGCSK